jgi:hypothetical protein
LTKSVNFLPIIILGKIYSNFVEINPFPLSSAIVVMIRHIWSYNRHSCHLHIIVSTDYLSRFTPCPVHFWYFTFTLLFPSVPPFNINRFTSLSCWFWYYYQCITMPSFSQIRWSLLFHISISSYLMSHVSLVNHSCVQSIVRLISVIMTLESCLDLISHLSYQLCHDCLY